MQLLIDGKEYDTPQAETVDELISSIPIDGRFPVSVKCYPPDVPLPNVYLVEIVTAPTAETRDGILSNLRELSSHAVFLQTACSIGLLAGDDCQDEVVESMAWWDSLVSGVQAISLLDGEPWHPDEIRDTLASLASIDTSESPESLAGTFESLAEIAERWHKIFSENP